MRFKEKTREEVVQIFANFIIDGYAQLNKNNPNSNMRKLMTGLMGGVEPVYFFIALIAYELNINNSFYLLEYWEKMVGIPDKCFPGNGTVEERRSHVIVKLALMNVQTADDIIKLLNLLGYEAEITPAIDRAVFPIEFPYYFFANNYQARSTIIIRIFGTGLSNVRFPLPFPIQFTSLQQSIAECVIDKIKPAHIHVIYEFID